MASWVLRAAPTMPWSRVRFRMDIPVWTNRPIWSAKPYFTSPILSQETPAMIELKKQPYPSTALDHSLFEDPSDGYDTQLSPSLGHAHSRNPCAILLQLVKEQKFNDINRVYAELREMGVPIEPAPEYQDAAFDALQRESSRHEKLAAFVKWWSLIPLASDSARIDFKRWRALFLHADAPDLPLLMHFALVSASRGYALDIGTRVIVLILRYAPPYVSNAFMEELCRVATEYWKNTERTHRRDLLEWTLAKRIRIWFGLAIRVHCMAGRLEEAVTTLQLARSLDVIISPFTYDFLLGKLQHTLDLPRIFTVNTLRQQDPKSAGSEIARDRRPYSPVLAIPASNLPPDTLFPDNHSLAMALRLIKNNLSASSYPTPGALAAFIAAYKAAGHSYAIEVIRKRSFRASYQSTSMWILAEMLYHFRRDERLLMFATFGDYFYVVGGPRRSSRRVGRSKSRIRYDTTFTQPFPLLPPIPLEQKMWPSSHHTALLWRVAAKDRSTVPHLEELYTDLLEQVTAAQNPDFQRWAPAAFAANGVPDAEGELPPYPDAISPRVVFDSAHFNVFVEVFAKRVGSTRAAGVVSDMFRFGIEPSVESWTILAAAFARAGDLPRLEKLLHRMQTPSSPKSGQPQPKTLPTPNIVTYTAIMQGLVRSKKFVEAGAVAERLEKMGYTSGTNIFTDDALLELSQNVSSADV